VYEWSGECWPTYTMAVFCPPDMITTMSTALSPKQADLLRELSRRTAPVPVDHLDGRVLRALESRNFVQRRDGWVMVTDEGRSHFQTNVRRRRKVGRHAAEPTPRSARAESILRAVEILELALPLDAEMQVGDVHAYADDVVHGLRVLARQLAEGRGGAAED
jgi:hypothetical protein